MPMRPACSSKPLLVLDVDGVMLDAERSFMEAVARALRELAPGLDWTDEHFRRFKRVGGFNNDFRLTAGALALHETGGMDRLEGAAGVGFPDLEGRIRELEPSCQRVVQRHYAETRRLEVPLITLPALEATGLELAICTGRPPAELSQAFETLGFELPAVCDSEPRFRKPSPDGLLVLAERFKAQEIIFAGDTRDDAAALRAARGLRPEIKWTFAAIGPERERIALPGDLQAETLRELLPQISKG